MLFCNYPGELREYTVPELSWRI